MNVNCNLQAESFVFSYIKVNKPAEKSFRPLYYRNIAKTALQIILYYTIFALLEECRIFKIRTMRGPGVLGTGSTTTKVQSFRACSSIESSSRSTFFLILLLLPGMHSFEKKNEHAHCIAHRKNNEEFWDL